MNERDFINSQLACTFDNFSSQLFLTWLMIPPFCPRLYALIEIPVIAKIHFRFWCALQYKGGGILVVKNNLGDWRSPYVQTILSRKEGNWKVNAELVQNFPHVLHNIVTVMCHVPAFIKKRGVIMDK